jgi:CRISPR-associated endoribonuclease Cas6
MYAFNLRGLDVNFILKMKRQVMALQQGSIKAVAAEIRQQPYRPITEIHTLTPAVATINGKSWTREDGIGVLMERIHANAVKKHRSFYGELPEPAENFIEVIEQTNDKPIRIRYKNTSLLGCKLNLIIKPDEISQKIAYTIMGSGLLEKNSIGLGYCRAK